ncbi:hypothetical protein D9M68_675280 [compost metagenome]
MELRNYLNQQNRGNDDSYYYHGNGVVHCLLDLGFQCLCLFLVGGDAIQQGFQCASLLTGVNQVAVKLVEIFGLLAQGVGQAVTGRDLLLHFFYQLAHGRLFEAFADDLEGLHQRHAGFHHGRHLPGEEGNVHRLDLLARTQQRRRFFAHLGGIDALLAKLRFHQCGILAGDFTFDLGAFLIGAFPGEGTCFQRFFRHG